MYHAHTEQSNAVSPTLAQINLRLMTSILMLLSVEMRHVVWTNRRLPQTTFTELLLLFFFPQYTFSFNTTLSVSLRVNSWVETLCILERRKVVNNTVELKIALIYNDSL